MSWVTFRLRDQSNRCILVCGLVSLRIGGQVLTSDWHSPAVSLATSCRPKDPWKGGDTDWAKREAKGAKWPQPDDNNSNVIFLYSCRYPSLVEPAGSDGGREWRVEWIMIRWNFYYIIIIFYPSSAARRGGHVARKGLLDIKIRHDHRNEGFSSQQKESYIIM